MKSYTNINHLLYCLGVTANYTGFFHASYAVKLCIEQPERLLLVTKWVYPDVAKQYGTNWKAVERNIRTVRNVIWKQDHSLLEQLAGRKLPHKPGTAQLLAILTYTLLSPHCAGPLSIHRLGEPVAFAGENHDMRMVNEAVDKGSGEAVIAKDSVPLRELQVGSNNKALSLVTI